MKVKDSLLYKTLCEAVRKEDHAELLRMLGMIAMPCEQSPWLGLDSDTLLNAFLWGSSPQGTRYWSELSTRLQQAGWECY